MKNCRRCGEEKPLDSFYLNHRLSHGVDNLCKPCRKTASAEYYAANSVRLRAKTAAYTAANPEWKKQYDADYAARNSHRISERQEAWRQANRRQQRRWQTEYYASNPDRRLGCILRSAARRAQVANAMFTMDQLRNKWEYWSGCCWVCGEPATAVDHVKPLARGGAHMICNLRPICQTCNLRKRDKWPLPSRAIIAGFAEWDQHDGQRLRL